MARKLATAPNPQLTDDDEPNDPQDQNPTDDPQDDPNGGDDTGDEDDDADPEGADSLGDPGKKALAAMKAARNDERAKRRDLEKRLADLEAAQNAQGKSPDEQAIDTARAEARAEALQQANQRVIRSEVRAAAAGKFRDPSDALAFLDLADFDVDDNGDVDPEDIQDALTDLLERKPHLAAQGGSSSFDSARGKPKRGKKLTQSDLKGMSPAEINKAYREGRIEM